jgi:hypothetical protein
MGAAASALSSPDEKGIGTLSIQAKRKFKLYEEEICMLNLSVMETEQLLADKYKELHNADKEARSPIRSNELVPPAEPIIVTPPIVVVKPLPSQGTGITRPRSKSISSGPSTTATTKSLPSINKAQSRQSKQADHIIVKPNKPINNNNKRRSLPNLSTNTLAIKELIEKKLSPKHTTLTHASTSPILLTMKEECGEEVEQLCKAPLASEVITTDYCTPLLTSPKKEYVCKLCNKTFRTQAMLSTHLSYSQLHRQALLDLHHKYKAVYDDVDRLDRMAYQVIDNLHRLQSERREKIDHSTQGTVTQRKRWQQAIVKVMNQCSTRRYIRRLSESKAKIPEADLIGREYKFFWRHRLHVVFYVYFHTLLNCIEVIVQVLPNNMQDSTAHPRFIQRLYFDNNLIQSALLAEYKKSFPISTTEPNTTLVTHILNRLTIDSQSHIDGEEDVQDNVESNIIYFDTMLYPIKASPILETVPQNLYPAVVADEQKMQWHGSAEVEEKLKQLVIAQEELHNAVVRAEKLSKVNEHHEVDDLVLEEVAESLTKALVIDDSEI